MAPYCRPHGWPSNSQYGSSATIPPDSHSHLFSPSLGSCEDEQKVKSSGTHDITEPKVVSHIFSANSRFTAKTFSEVSCSLEDLSSQKAVKSRNLKDFFSLGPTVGNDASTRMAESLETQRLYVCKSTKSPLEKEALDRVKGHENVMELQDFFSDETTGDVKLISALCSAGNFSDYLRRKRKSLKENGFVMIFRQAASALQHCHIRGIVHRDVRPENLLVATLSKAEDGTRLPVLKLAGFDHASVLNHDERTQGAVGSLAYRAPEAVKGEECGVEMDCWSLGVTLYSALSGTMPFKGKTEKETEANICGGMPDFESKPWLSFSAEAKDLCKRLLTTNPAERISAKEALRHPWLLLPLPMPETATATAAATSTHIPSDASYSKFAPPTSDSTARFPPSPRTCSEPSLSSSTGTPVTQHRPIASSKTSELTPTFCFPRAFSDPQHPSASGMFLFKEWPMAASKSVPCLPNLASPDLVPPQSVQASKRVTKKPASPSSASWPPASVAQTGRLCLEGGHCCAAPCSTPSIFRQMMPVTRRARFHIELPPSGDAEQPIESTAEDGSNARSNSANGTENGHEPVRGAAGRPHGMKPK
eukprot:TRINITY_DN6845_c0_g1_i1.p1 TRINITY_DN6845_c0_g1~~TRINITY_DN6845_c0_g1_i1.p1  ORF type:complete len:591 (+),score=36.26 TRINITY_DN6845_c0_g1_i1:65-1837(+)